MTAAVTVGINNRTDQERIDLPPGFRFHPTDEEIITHYLTPKVINHSFSSLAMGEVDLNKCEPWDLPSQAKMGEKEWYFFCQKDRKYPTGTRTNRATEQGYWKATGKDREIYRGRNMLVGMKKTLVFYRGRAPKGEKSNWVMHEFRIEGKPPPLHNIPKSSKDEWVVCRVFHKNMGLKRSPVCSSDQLARMSSFGDDCLESPNLPPLLDSQFFNSSSYNGGDDAFEFKGNIIAQSSTAAMPQSSYISSLMAMDSLVQENNNNIKKNLLIPNSFTINNPSLMFNQQLSSASTPYNVALPQGYGYLHQHQAFMKAIAGKPPEVSANTLKVPQQSNQSMVSASQDTGLSTDYNAADRNTEISSTTNELGSFEDLDGPSSGGEMANDLDNMWKF